MGVKNSPQTIEEETKKIYGNFYKIDTVIIALLTLPFSANILISFEGIAWAYWLGIVGSLRLGLIYWNGEGKIARRIVKWASIAELAIVLIAIVGIKIFPGLGFDIISKPASWETNKATVALKQSWTRQIDENRAKVINEINERLAKQDADQLAGKPVVSNISVKNAELYNDIAKEMRLENKLVPEPTTKSYYILISTAKPSAVATLIKKGKTFLRETTPEK